MVVTVFSHYRTTLFDATMITFGRSVERRGVHSRRRVVVAIAVVTLNVLGKSFHLGHDSYGSFQSSLILDGEDVVV